MRMMAGRQCIITGASRGLGACIARKFWDAGADLLLVARSKQDLRRLESELERRPSQKIHSMVCDLTDRGSAAQIVDEAVREIGGVSVLVNNAAVQGPVGPVWENDWTEWEDTLRVNLLSPVDLCRRCVPLMIQTGGKIVNISGGGAAGPRPRLTAYAAAKAALVRFSETLAQETLAFGIDVNCVAPGAMNSTMTEEILAAGPTCAGEKEYNDALRIREQGAQGMQRATALCVFLASAESDGITGKLISAAWDPWETLDEHREDLQRTDVYTLRRILPHDRGMQWEVGRPKTARDPHESAGAQKRETDESTG